MGDDLVLDQRRTGEADRCETLTPLVRRIVAGNSGPFTFTGTCTYIVGRGEVAVIDPGPESPEHVEAILAALEGERVAQIVVTHTHRDHSPGARLLKARTGAPIVGCGPHEAARALAAGETSTLEGGGDRIHRPDRQLRDGDTIAGPGWTLRAIETPGHTMNHLVFELAEERALFSGDHVMAWSTTFIGPPDGAMGPYLRSLETLKGLDVDRYWPGHGGPVEEPARFLRALIHHRRQREASVIGRLAAGDRAIAAIVAAIYQGLAPALQGAAALSVFAHLEDLVARGEVETDGPPRPDGAYRLPGGRD